jgi:chromodomain-helicase-DNA-binding protein 7
MDEYDIDHHLKLAKYRTIMFNNKPRYELYSKDKGKQPVFLKGQRLKGYQIDGTNWLINAWFENRNVVLADEMGLGKTIQTIGFLNYLFTEHNNKGPFLIIAPLTTLAHWKQVADEWTDMNTVLYYDASSFEGRSVIRHYEWFHTEITSDGRPTQKYKVIKFNIVLTSFEVF